MSPMTRIGIPMRTMSPSERDVLSMRTATRRVAAAEAANSGMREVALPNAEASEFVAVTTSPAVESRLTARGCLDAWETIVLAEPTEDPIQVVISVICVRASPAATRTTTSRNTPPAIASSADAPVVRAVSRARPIAQGTRAEATVPRVVAATPSRRAGTRLRRSSRANRGATLGSGQAGPRRVFHGAIQCRGAGPSGGSAMPASAAARARGSRMWELSFLREGGAFTKTHDRSFARRPRGRISARSGGCP